jgi:hypothetical protein
MTLQVTGAYLADIVDFATSQEETIPRSDLGSAVRHNHTSTICGSSSGGRFNWIKPR